MPLRHKARECALQMLYQWDITGADPAMVEASFWKNTRGSRETRQFASSLLLGAIADSAEADRLIVLNARNWRLERIAAIDRNILRMAVHELLHRENPAKVIINEALELAKKFSEPEAGPFINAVLDAIRKSVEASEQA